MRINREEANCSRLEETRAELQSMQHVASTWFPRIFSHAFVRGIQCSRIDYYGSTRVVKN